MFVVFPVFFGAVSLMLSLKVLPPFIFGGGSLWSLKGLVFGAFSGLLVSFSAILPGSFVTFIFGSGFALRSPLGLSLMALCVFVDV